MQRKRRQPTPFFQTPPPFNPISGKYENLSPAGVSPYCAVMQVAAEDTYDNYVICRGFDTRILKFVDYEESNPDKPGISVAKPFGSRGNRTYHVGQIYPAFLPTQGSASYVPPSPDTVLWRLGQNPGKIASTDNGGQPADLADEISALYDHNSKAINWMLIDSVDGTRWIEFTLTSALTSPGTASATVDYDSQDESNVGETVTVTGLINYDADVGHKGVALQKGEDWVVVELPQATGLSEPRPAFIVQGVLGTRSGGGPEAKFPAYGGDLTTAYVDDSSLINISPAPYTNFTPFETCGNPFMLNGEEGDTFIAWRDPNAEEEEFILINVYSKKATIFFEFSSDRGSGLYDVTCTGVVKSWRHAGDDSPLVLKDTMGRAIGAKSGDYGYAEWNTDKQCWSIISAQHYATRILGKTTSGSGASPWTCSPLIGFDGHVSTGDTMSVIIDAGWPHPGINKKVWYELDPADGTWHAYQMEFTCPDA